MGAACIPSTSGVHSLLCARSEAAVAAQCLPGPVPPSNLSRKQQTHLRGLECINRSSRPRSWRGVVSMGLKAVESFDTSFNLSPEAREVLEFLLSSDAFLQQVASQPGLPSGCRVEWSGELFQPVPWSPTTKHGMPQEYERFLSDKDNFVIINVPPNFMFKAQIFKPSRLCAVYKIHSESP